MRFFRFTAIFLVLASPLGSLQPAAAVDLTDFTPFAANVACKHDFQNSLATTCSGSAALPNRQIVLEYISFSCFGIPQNGRLVQADVNTRVGGLESFANLHLPVAASLGQAGNGETAGGQVVRVYADPNSTIGVFASIAGSSPDFTCTFHLYGEQSPEDRAHRGE
jgi:hypothetical protein